MKKLSIGLLASSLAFGPQSPARHIYVHMHLEGKACGLVQIGSNRRLALAPWIVGGMVGCASIGLLVGAAYAANTHHRELTCREANMIALAASFQLLALILWISVES